MRSPFEILPQARTVVVYFLPFSAKIVYSNGPGTIASHEWVLAYVETNALIEALSQELVAWLGKKGIASVAPPPTHNFDPLRLVSDWSHKHAGFIAGLGTFGLHRMLITAKGCGGRLGSLVTAADIEPTPRPDEPYCLFAHDGGCRSCLNRCPSQALQENGSTDRLVIICAWKMGHGTNCWPRPTSVASAPAACLVPCVTPSKFRLPATASKGNPAKCCTIKQWEKTSASSREV